MQMQLSDVRAELASLQQQLSVDRQQHQLEQQSLCQQHAMVSHSALCTVELLLPIRMLYNVCVIQPPPV